MSGLIPPSSVPTSMRPVRHTRLPAMCPPPGWRWRWTTSTAPVPALVAAPQGAGSNYKKSADTDPDPAPEQGKPVQREALGRSRGGLSTKVHLAADSRCRPLGFCTTVGQRHDAVAVTLTLAQVVLARTGPGRPRTRPDAVLADKAYSSQAIRAHLAKRGIKAVIAIKDDQRAARQRKGSRGGRPDPPRIPRIANPLGSARRKWGS